MSDTHAIRRLLSRWLQLDDRYEDETWIEECLADDFVFSIGGVTYAGKDAIRDLNQQRADGPPRGMHILSEPVIDIEGNTAHAVTDFVYVTASEAGLGIALAGRYDDRFTRDAAGRWTCTSRSTSHLQPEGS